MTHFTSSDYVFAAHAPELAARGYAVFPLAPGRKIPMYGSRGHLDATMDADQIREWCDRYPTANIGIRPAAHTIVIDIDNPPLFKLWRLGAGLHLPATCTVRTRRGVHLYYYRPESLREVPLLGALSSAGARLADVKTDRGFVLAPGSRVDLDGGGVFEYRVQRTKSMTTLPDRWAQYLRRPERPAPTMGSQQGESLGAYGIDGANRLVRLMATKRPGDGRRGFFQWAVCEIHRKYGGDPDAVRRLIDAAVAAGKDRGDLENIAAWASAQYATTTKEAS